MSKIQDVEENLIDYCKKYFDTYFIKRDLEGIKNIICDSVTGFGTGKDEDVNNQEDAISIYSRDIKEAPNKINYTITNMSAVALAENYGFTFGKLNIKTFISGQQIKLNNLRFSIVLKKKKMKWEIVHLHMSFPSVDHGENESYPVKELEKRNKILQRRVEEKTRELGEALKKTKKLAITDKLTGLYNRDYMIGEMQRLDSKRQLPLSIVMSDINGLKLVNDGLGHKMGDKLIKEAAGVFKKCCRQEDIVVRWGGDEIVILLPQTSSNEAEKIIKRIKDECSKIEVEGIPLSIAFGYATKTDSEQSLDHILQKADERMYNNKFAESKTVHENLVDSISEKLGKKR